MRVRPIARCLLPALVVLAVPLFQARSLSQAPSPTRDYPVQPVPFTAVKLTDGFWAPRIEVNRTATVPVAFEQCERTNRVDLFVRAAQVLRGEEPANRNPPGYPFDDTDVYKVIEGAAYTLSVHPDPRLDAYVDGLIAKIAAAQEPDGYLYTTRTINPKEPHRWAGPERWVLERDDSHELYNLGHLFEAASAHYLATGKQIAARRRGEIRGSAGEDVRARQALDLARPPDHRDGAGEDGAGDGEARVPHAREVPARRARPGAAAAGRAGQPARARLQPGAAARRRADRAGRSRGARDVHVFGHGRRRRAHRRPDLRPRHRHDLDQHRHQEALHHRRHRCVRRRRSVRQPLPAAQPDRLQRDLRLGRHGLLEPPAVPAPRRREVPRRDGAHALQRPDLRRRARRQDLLLPEPARVARPAPAQPLVRRRLLSGEHRPVPAVRARLRLREDGRRDLREPLRAGHRRGLARAGTAKSS